MNPQTLLAYYLHTHGPIKTARVSSAQARGAAKRYSYWGAVRYQVTLTQDGRPYHRPLERASSDRRSVAGAERDRGYLCQREGRIPFDALGTLDDAECRRVLALVT